MTAVPVLGYFRVEVSARSELKSIVTKLELSTSRDFKLHPEGVGTNDCSSVSGVRTERAWHRATIQHKHLGATP